MSSLWGDFFTEADDTEKVNNILKKVKETKKKVEVEGDVTKRLKSKAVSIDDKLNLIRSDVDRILGKFADDTLVIRDIDTFRKYIDAAISNGIIAIDTETNNSLNTFDCLLMGLCLYTPGHKQAYIPVNHCNYKIEDGEVILLDKLKDQLTEEQIKIELQRIKDSGTLCVYHNAVFDVEVIDTTCGIMLPIYWDTMVGAHLLNENELKGLKMQYKLHINQEQEKYDIEHLFQSLPYAIFEPELFALYAATDSKITMDLYDYQLNEFKKEENAEIYTLLREVEIPILPVVVNMEKRGFLIDLDYANKLSSVYHERLDGVQVEIDAELLRLKPIIDSWKLTREANADQRVYPAKKTKMSEEKIIKSFPLVDEKGKRYKIGKSKVMQLSDPIDIGSPTQMSILLYDILKLKTESMSTDADTLNELADRGIEICKILLKKRELDILVNAFIDKLPEIVDKNNIARTRFNTCGTATGRFSSSGLFNIQQIPSHAKDVRLMFKAPDIEHRVELDNDNYYRVKYTDEVLMMNNDWKRVCDLQIGDKILTNDTVDEIKNIVLDGNDYLVYVV